MSAPVFITPTFAVAPALSPADLEALAARGVRAVISNRPDGEEEGQLSGRHEAVHAWRQGLAFRHIPVGKHELFEDHTVEAMAEALAGLDGPVVAHCKSGLRSVILWAAASARSEPVDCVIAAARHAGYDISFLRDELAAQADRRRWIGRPAALDCAAAGAGLAA